MAIFNSDSPLAPWQDRMATSALAGSNDDVPRATGFTTADSMVTGDSGLASQISQWLSSPVVPGRTITFTCTVSDSGLTVVGGVQQVGDAVNGYGNDDNCATVDEGHSSTLSLPDSIPDDSKQFLPRTEMIAH